uniref:DSBA-like thioredoxin domain-containing protein n=1 Tax=Caenorhabditis japonica TaxID=281687 RepID=A0A8R1DPN7_CAEJA
MTPSLPRVKCFFDVVCPNSWITIQALTSHNSLFEKVDFEPVCDFKIGILHNAAIWNQRRQVHNSRIWKSKKEVSEVPAEVQEDLGILKKIDERGKKLIECKTVELPADWQKTYKLAMRRGSIIPQLYLTAIRERYPDLYEPAIHHLGKRLWDQRLPVHYGCHMSTVSRELGIPFKTAEDIVARLSTQENRSILHNNCKEAVDFKLTEAPGLILTLNDRDTTVKVDTVNELFNDQIFSKFSKVTESPAHAEISTRL